VQPTPKQPIKEYGPSALTSLKSVSNLDQDMIFVLNYDTSKGPHFLKTQVKHSSKLLKNFSSRKLSQ
jgi:hypothetical protein